ncbi:hypothetical protein AAC387_Pa12g1710 [Persea americana]
MDPSSEAGLGNGGLNQGDSGLPFKCSGIDQVRPSLGSQLQKPFVETTNQFQILSPQQRLERQLEQEQEQELLLQELRLLQYDKQWLEQEQQEHAARLLLAQS